MTLEIVVAGRAAIGHTDSLAFAQTCAPGSFDAIVTDPPYGLNFMGKAWDHGVPGAEFWHEFLRITKPGAHLVAFGGTRTWHRLACAIEDAGWEIRDTFCWLYGQGYPKSKSSLKPAHEPIILARRPPAGAPLNIDACRIPVVDQAAYNNNNSGRRGHADDRSRQMDFKMGCGVGSDLGRWPANVVLDEEAAVMLDAAAPSVGAAAAASGPTHSGPSTRDAMAGGFNGMGDRAPAFHADSGGASRFFYCAKASRAERTHNKRLENKHPTVKPIDLMRWLCRLVTPPGGLVLDPFCGSGSTGVASLAEGLGFVGIDSDAEAVATACARLRDCVAQETRLAGRPEREDLRR